MEIVSRFNRSPRVIEFNLNFKIILFSSLFFVFLIPNIYAEEAWSNWEGETEINVEIIGNSIINLDTNERLVRAYIDILNFDPSDGRYYMKIIQPETERILSENEIIVREKSNEEAGADVAYMINEDAISTNGTAVLGDYLIEITTEHGVAFGAATFSIIHPSVTGIAPVPVVTPAEEIDEEIRLLNQTETEEETTETTEEPIEEAPEMEDIQKIPDWVKNIFILYADGSITENELIAALAFLIEQGIIIIDQ